jgi:hypothetical protein
VHEPKTSPCSACGARPGGPALAWTTPPWPQSPPPQHLPAAACNAGTMNARAHIPATTGSGKTTPGHMAAPGTANVTLRHGG